MIRCSWQYAGPNPCQDAAELVCDGRGLCEAHALYLQDAKWRELMADIQRTSESTKAMMRELDESMARRDAEREARRAASPWRRLWAWLDGK